MTLQTVFVCAMRMAWLDVPAAVAEAVAPMVSVQSCWMRCRHLAFPHL